MGLFKLPISIINVQTLQKLKKKKMIVKQSAKKIIMYGFFFAATVN